jgi:hypothetical protein
MDERVPMARCRLGVSSRNDPTSYRYVPLGLLGLWRFLMEERHHKTVVLEAVSVWVPESPELWNSRLGDDDLEPVLRVRFSVRGDHGILMPVERFFAALNYPVAQEALLSHYQTDGYRVPTEATAGYFLPPTRARKVKDVPVAVSAH